MPDLFTPIELFREAVGFTHQRFGFPERLIEKDYVCTIILEFLTAGHADVVFKGGTCLAKIYADFYRMSEDLDFVIPMPIDAPGRQFFIRFKALLMEPSSYAFTERHDNIETIYKSSTKNETQQT